MELLLVAVIKLGARVGADGLKMKRNVKYIEDNGNWSPLEASLQSSRVNFHVELKIMLTLCELISI